MLLLANAVGRLTVRCERTTKPNGAPARIDRLKIVISADLSGETETILYVL